MADAATSPRESSDDRSEFERFEDLTRRVVSVPKSEADALRKKPKKPKKAQAKSRPRRAA